jgi:hypothetical protein
MSDPQDWTVRMGDEQSIHIEHYFPKGYDPDSEPWKSIKAHHNAALAAEREKLMRSQHNHFECHQALAAEQERAFAAQQAALKEGIRSGKLVEALGRITDSGDKHSHDIAAEALAKVKGGK